MDALSDEEREFCRAWPERERSMLEILRHHSERLHRITYGEEDGSVDDKALRRLALMLANDYLIYHDCKIIERAAEIFAGSPLQ